jgi:hypothetical protein
MKYWEIIADNLKKRGWSLGYVAAESVALGLRPEPFYGGLELRLKE